MEYVPVQKLQVSGTTDRVVDFADARLASFDILASPNNSNMGEILNIYDEHAMHNRVDFRRFNSGQGVVKSLSVAKHRRR